MNPTSTLIFRGLLQASDIDTFDGIPETSVSPTTTTAAAVHPTNTSSTSAVRRPFNHTTPLDSSMALTILVLLTALFFLGFFSVYIRRFTSVANEDASAPPSVSLRRPPPSKGGLDISAVKSLPLVAYGKAARHPMIDDCPICLSEFHEKEIVKVIPHCSHVFHPGCIDTWLSAHVTCPLCRSAQLFKSVEEVSLDVTHDKNGVAASDVGEESTVVDGDTWRQESSGGVGSSCNRSILDNHQAVVHTSTSC